VPIVEDDRPLPTSLLAVVEFPEMGHYPLPGPLVGPNTLHQRPVAMDLARLFPRVLPQKHRPSPGIQHARQSGRSKREGFHYIAPRRFPLPRNQDLRRMRHTNPPKIDQIFAKVRNLG
jgi:hypothetical protein